MFRYTEALWFLTIDSCPASCPFTTSFFSLSLSSFLTPQCFNQFLASDLCVCDFFFFTLSVSSLSLCLLFLSRSILLHSSSISGQGGRPSSSRCWHLSIWKHTGAVREAFTLYSSHSIHSALLARFNSNCVRKQMVVLVSEFG